MGLGLIGAAALGGIGGAGQGLADYAKQEQKTQSDRELLGVRFGQEQQLQEARFGQERQLVQLREQAEQAKQLAIKQFDLNEQEKGRQRIAGIIKRNTGIAPAVSDEGHTVPPEVQAEADKKNVVGGLINEGEVDAADKVARADYITSGAEYNREHVESSRRRDRTYQDMADAAMVKATKPPAGAKELTPTQMDAIERDAAKLSTRIVTGQHPFGDPLATSAKDKADTPLQSLAATKLSTMRANAYRQGVNVTEDQLVNTVGPLTREASRIAIQQANDQASQVFGKDKAPSPEMLKKLQGQGVPDGALTSPNAFKRYVYETSLDDAWQQAVEAARAGKKPAADKPAASASGGVVNAAAAAPEPARAAASAPDPNAPDDLRLRGSQRTELQTRNMKESAVAALQKQQQDLARKIATAKGDEAQRMNQQIIDLGKRIAELQQAA